MQVNENTSLDDLLKIAQQTVTELTADEEFIVKELFRGFEWNRIAKGNRTKLGALFFSFSQHEGAKLIEALGKTPQNQQKYKKL